MKQQFAIWSKEHQAYWKPNRTGYTINPHEAGIYDLGDALEISNRAAIGANNEPEETLLPLLALETMKRNYTLKHSPAHVDDAVETDDVHDPMRCANCGEMSIELAQTGFCPHCCTFPNS